MVWVNLPSKVYHFAGTKSYGTTKRGAYMCEKEAIAAEDRASKTEKHPRAASEQLQATHLDSGQPRLSASARRRTGVLFSPTSAGAILSINVVSSAV